MSKNDDMSALILCLCHVCARLRIDHEWTCDGACDRKGIHDPCRSPLVKRYIVYRERHRGKAIYTVCVYRERHLTL
eukprot:g58609.t1